MLVIRMLVDLYHTFLVTLSSSWYVQGSKLAEELTE